jgi:hypothetical protein
MYVLSPPKSKKEVLDIADLPQVLTPKADQNTLANDVVVTVPLS